MSIQLQIAIPLFIVAAALVGISIWRKYWKFEVVLLCALSLGLSIFMTTQHFGAKQERTVAAGSDSGNAISLMLAQEYMLEGQYNEAADVLQELQKGSPQDQQVLLAAARCALLKGNYAQAVQLYRQAGGDQEEVDNATSLHLLGFSGNAQALENEKAKSGVPLLLKPADHEKSAETVLDQLEDQQDAYEEEYGEDALDACKYACKITVAFSHYVASSSDQVEEEYKSALKKLEKRMEEVPELQANPHLRLARMKGYVLGGDYEKLAKAADRNATAEELVILSQLLVDGAVKAKHFADGFINVEKAVYERIHAQGEKILDNNKKDLEKAQYKKYKAQLERLKENMKDPALMTLRQDLLKYAQDGPIDMRSKSYLALAKIENDAGDKDLSAQYISEAIGTAGDSDDRNYSIPMNQMAAIIQGNAQPGDIKNVAEYVSAALDHSLPLDVKVSEITTGETDNTMQDSMTNTVTQSTATINIGSINKDEFPQVVARIQVQSKKYATLKQLQEHMQVYDCGSRVQNFTLEKIEYERSRIVLLCDVSGSMSGSVQDLKNAIIAFAENMQEGEQVSVIGFDDDIKFSHPFTSDPEKVKSYAESMGAYGGTELFDSILYSGGEFTYDINSNDVIIALTDGYDNNPAREAEIREKISAMVADKDLTLYTLGLGSSVDTDYLTLIAQYGNGSFLPVKDEASLNEFYDFIHGQLANQYLLTYTAKNQTLNKRTLEISMEGELGGDTATYYLVEPEFTDEDSDSYNPYTVVDTKLSVSGLATKLLWKSSQSQTVDLKGAGFDAGDEITVRMIGNVKYDMAVSFVDANTYRITVPASVATGIYDFEICLRGETIQLEDELTIAVHSDMKNFRFGAYSFTALNSYVDDYGNTVLSGNVTMNGWLHFKGDLTIRAGYESSQKAYLTDNSGFYVSYQMDNSTGLAHSLAEWGVPLSCPAIRDFYITNAPYTPTEFEDFEVDKQQFGQIVNIRFLFVENPSVSIYPDMLRFKVKNVNFNLPFQDQLVQNLNLTPHSGTVDTNLLLAATSIDGDGSIAYENHGDGIQLVSLPLNMEKLSFTFNTLRNDYSFEGAVGFKALGSLEGLELKLGWKGGRFDSLGLRTDGPELHIVDAPIPVSMGDFGFELKDFSQYESDDSALDKLLKTNINIVFDVNVASLNAYLPDIAELINDKDEVAIAQLADCTLSLTLREFRLSFDADMKLLTILDVGQVHVSMGKYDYTNALIGYYNETQYGLQLKITRFGKLDTPNLDVSLSGSGEFTLGYPYSGVHYSGSVDFEVGWWILKAGVHLRGDALIGVYKNRAENLQFSIIVKGTDTDGDSAGFHFYVVNWDWDVYTY